MFPDAPHNDAYMFAGLSTVLWTVQFMVMDIIFIIDLITETPVRRLQTTVYNAEIWLETRMGEHSFKYGLWWKMQREDLKTISK